MYKWKERGNRTKKNHTHAHHARPLFKIKLKMLNEIEKKMKERNYKKKATQFCVSVFLYWNCLFQAPNTTQINILSNDYNCGTTAHDRLFFSLSPSYLRFFCCWFLFFFPFFKVAKIIESDMIVACNKSSTKPRSKRYIFATNSVK